MPRPPDLPGVHHRFPVRHRPRHVVDAGRDNVVTVTRTDSPAVSRRQLLGFGGAAAVLLGTGAWNAASAFAAPTTAFTLGVASGDPSADGVVLWTRLAPDPFAVDGAGGMPAQPVRVEYEV